MHVIHALTLVCRAKPPCRSIHAWLCCWCKVINNTRLCSRVCPQEYSRRTHYGVADIYGLRNNAGFYCICRFPERDNHRGANFALEMDAGKYQYSPNDCLCPGLLLSRITPLVCVLLIPFIPVCTDVCKGTWRRGSLTELSNPFAVSEGPRSRQHVTCTTRTNFLRLRMQNVRAETQ